jgi:GT2 family glycosyltransferase
MTKNYKIAYVILHYVTAKDTIECIKSIENLQTDYETSIVVVDNASGNDSLEEVKEITSNYNNITYIKNEKNLGFAKGNNVGFRYAKYELNADFIILLNNDTVIEQPDFSEKIVQKYEFRGGVRSTWPRYSYAG